MSTFKDAWKFYYDLEWHSIPTRPESKLCAMDGVTGKEGIDLAEEELAEISAGQMGDYGLALRMDSETCGIDVDAYKPEGAATYARCVKEWGPLPDTAVSSARFDTSPDSGIRFFRIPAGTILKTDLGKDSGIEIIQRHHRYAMVSPSWNPKSNTGYRWKDDEVPNVKDLPDLPESWLNGLKVEHKKYSAPSLNVTVTPAIQKWAMGKTLEILRELKNTGVGGTRNGAANEAAFKLGQLIGRGALPESDALNGMLQICSTFTDDTHWPYGDSDEVERVARAGMEAGARKPWEPWPPDLPPDDVVIPEGGLFNKGSLRTKTTAEVVQGMGRIAHGLDGLFWEWSGGVWRPNNGVIAGRCAALMGDQFRTAHVSNVEAFIKATCPQILCDPVPEYINFKNGMLLWRTELIEAHDADLYSTVQLNCDWDESATCPEIDKFFADIMHSDAVELLWQHIGYMILSGNPMQKILLWLGTGRNGKGVTLRLIRKLLGDQNISNETQDSLAQNRFAPAQLFGRIANIAGDIDSTYQEYTGKLKTISGGDAISAEHKNQRAFMFEPWCVLLFSANEIAPSADSSYGYTRRYEVLEFPNQFEEGSDPGLEGRLSKELPGMAVKAVKALRKLMSNEKFVLPPSALATRQKWVSTVNQAQRWADMRTIDCEVGEETTKLEFYKNYEDWCKAEKAMALGQYKFYGKLDGLEGWQRHKPVGKTEVFKGKRLRNLTDGI